MNTDTDDLNPIQTCQKIFSNLHKEILKCLLIVYYKGSEA